MKCISNSPFYFVTFSHFSTFSPTLKSEKAKKLYTCSKVAIQKEIHGSGDLCMGSQSMFGTYREH